MLAHAPSIKQLNKIFSANISIKCIEYSDWSYNIPICAKISWPDIQCTKLVSIEGSDTKVIPLNRWGAESSLKLYIIYVYITFKFVNIIQSIKESNFA